jgi:hypothetical protein
MKRLASFLLVFAAAIAGRAEPAPFCEATVPEKLVTLMQESPRWDPIWCNDVVLRPLAPAEEQAVRERYKGRVPKPKLEVKRQVAPMFPVDMEQKHASGAVTAYLVIAKNGTVKAIYVTNYTSESFARSAALALNFWQFTRIKEECLVAIPVPFSFQATAPTPAPAPAPGPS